MVKVLLLAIFCATILWRQTTCAYVQEPELGNDFPTKRKSSLFLVHNSIPALDDIVSPEEIVPQNKDFVLSAESLADSDLESTILGGNYPKSGLTILKPKMPPPKLNSGDEASNSQLLNKLLLMDPIEQLLLETNVATSNENDTENGETTENPLENEELAAEPRSLMGRLGKFAKKMLECKMKLIFCKRKNIISCYLYCLLGKHPIGQVVKGNVVSLIKSLCDPLGTNFEGGVKLFENHGKNIKTLSHYLAMLNIVPETFKRFTRLAANAIPSMILKHSSIAEASLFQGALSDLESDAKVASSRPDTTSELSNPGCTTLNILRPVQKIVSMLYKSPKIVDIFLPGLWTLRKLFRLIATHAMKASLKAFGGALDILIGLNCGLIHYNQNGKTNTCEKNEQLIWKATEDELILPENGNPVVCGAVPYIPPFVMDNLYPPIFIQDFKTSAAAPTPEESIMSLGARSDTDDKETNWLDQASKSLDIDDDR